MNGELAENFSRLSGQHPQQDEQVAALLGAQHAPTHAVVDAAAALLQKILQGLDAALAALALPSLHGNPFRGLTASDIAAICRDSGLRPEVADKVMAKFRSGEAMPAPAESADVPARMCPAFGARSLCTGNACGMNCASIPL